MPALAVALAVKVLGLGTNRDHYQGLVITSVLYFTGIDCTIWGSIKVIVRSFAVYAVEGSCNTSSTYTAKVILFPNCNTALLSVVPSPSVSIKGKVNEAVVPSPA